MADRRQIPPTFVGNQPQMLRDIRENLRHLHRQQTKSSDGTKLSGSEALNGNSSTPSKTRQQGRRISGQHAEALAAIRSSLEPYAASESGYSSCSECSTPSADSVNRHYLNQLKAIGYDEEVAAEALRVTSSRSIEAAIDLMGAEHLNRAGHLAAGTNVSQMKSPPPYNAAIHRISQEINSPKRPDSPAAIDPQLGQTVTTTGPGQQAMAEPPNAEWRVTRSVTNVQSPQPWQGRPTTFMQQRPTCGRQPQDGQTKFPQGTKMQVGWRAPPAVTTRPQGTSHCPSQVNPALGQAAPQFQVTAHVNLTANDGAGDYTPTILAKGLNVPSSTASPSSGNNPVSFRVLVHTNYPSNERMQNSGFASPCQAQGPQSTNVDGSRVPWRHSPVPSGLSSMTANSSAPVQHFVQSFDAKMYPPPAYAPLPQRPLDSMDSESMAMQTDPFYQFDSICSNSTLTPFGSQSSTSTLTPGMFEPSQTPQEQWRYSWNTETSSNSSVSDELPWSSSQYDSGPPSPSSDSSFGMEQGQPSPMINATGTVIYHPNSPRPKTRLPIPCMEPAEVGTCRSGMDVDDDEQSESDYATTTPGQRLREFRQKLNRMKNYPPSDVKFCIEQHYDNLMKPQHDRQRRRVQLEEEMAKVGLSEEAQSQMRKMLNTKETNYIRLKRSKMNKSMFERVAKIGIGAFGEVWLVRKTDSKQLYAMKILQKSEVLRRNQVAHVKAERDILAEADNAWVVKLYYSFQDSENLYFVMDYVPGGDLMSLLIKFGIFKEDLARFYIAELVLAIESVHNMGFVHRDIKPDNILIDKDGHIKLTDFGLCTGFRWTHDSKYYQKSGNKPCHSRQISIEPNEVEWEVMKSLCHCGQQPEQKTYREMKPLERRHYRQHMRCQAHSLVGTPNYIAPEVLMRCGYTQLCDWWSVGVILYEMLVGQPPFMAPTPQETQMKVINWESSLRIPPQANLSPAARDFILRLCTSPDRRLGANGADEIKAHPFFAHVNWNYGVRQMQAPHMPEIRYPTDISNFDAMELDRPSRSSEEEGKESGTAGGEDVRSTTHPKHAFYEFTFRRFFDEGPNYSSVHGDSDDSSSDTSKEPVYV